jgi:hypothetical protein
VVARVLVDPVVAGAHVLAVQEPQDALPEGTAALAADDLELAGLALRGVVHGAFEGGVDELTLVVDGVEVEGQLPGRHAVPTCRSVFWPTPRVGRNGARYSLSADWPPQASGAGTAVPRRRDEVGEIDRVLRMLRLKTSPLLEGESLRA